MKFTINLDSDKLAVIDVHGEFLDHIKLKHQIAGVKLFDSNGDPIDEKAKNTLETKAKQKAVLYNVEIVLPKKKCRVMLTANEINNLNKCIEEAKKLFDEYYAEEMTYEEFLYE